MFSAAAVFGDTNLELPSALSNRSIVEVHMDIGSHITLKSSESVVQVPLHARYPVSLEIDMEVRFCRLYSHLSESLYIFFCFVYKGNLKKDMYY